MENLAFAAARNQVAKRRGGNEKHHGVVFEPHRDRAAARPSKTLLVKKVVTTTICFDYPTSLFGCQEKPFDRNRPKKTKKGAKRAHVCAFLSHYGIFLHHLSNKFSPLP